MNEDGLMLKIPQKICVGFQNRTDTYTGKLAYVIYYDNKGKLRKEASWTSWRDKKIDPQEFNNEPTSGFVLNKKVGDYKSDWNHRMAHIRVYDPRGFEFEISVENLLYILQECTSLKGKGLEGEFVYAWDNKDLVLLPCDSADYKTSQKYTEGLNGKVGKADIVPGCIYRLKSTMEDVMYLGKLQNFDASYYVHSNVARLYNYEDKGMKHIFAHLDDRDESSRYIAASGFAQLSCRVTEDVSPEFANIFDEYKKSLWGGGIKSIEVVDDDQEVRYYDEKIIIHKGEYHKVRIELERTYWHQNVTNDSIGSVTSIKKYTITGTNIVPQQGDGILMKAKKSDFEKLFKFKRFNAVFANGKTAHLTSL